MPITLAESRGIIAKREKRLEKLWKAAAKDPNKCLDLGRDATGKRFLWDINEYSQGHVTWAQVGQGKTECILTSVHMQSLFNFQPGILQKDWLKSDLRRDMLEEEAKMRVVVSGISDEIEQITARIRDTTEKLQPLEMKLLRMESARLANESMLGAEQSVLDAARAIIANCARFTKQWLPRQPGYDSLQPVIRAKIDGVLTKVPRVISEAPARFIERSGRAKFGELKSELPRVIATKILPAAKATGDSLAGVMGSGISHSAMLEAAVLDSARRVASPIKREERDLRRKILPLRMLVDELEHNRLLLQYDRDRRIAAFNRHYNHREIRQKRYYRPPWAGLILDYKGNFSEYPVSIGRHYGRDTDLILITVYPMKDLLKGLKPIHRFNLFDGDPFKLSSADLAKLLRQAITSSKGKQGDSSAFYDGETQQVLQHGLSILRFGKTLHRLYGYEHMVPDIYRPDRMEVFYPNPSYLKKFIFGKKSLADDSGGGGGTDLQNNFYALLSEMGIPFRASAPTPPPQTPGAPPPPKPPSAGELAQYASPKWMQAYPKPTQPDKLAMILKCEEEINMAVQEFVNKVFATAGGSSDTKGNTVASVYQVLNELCVPEFEAVFAKDTTTTMEDLNDGKFVCLNIPHSYQAKRTALMTIFTEFYYGMIFNTRYTVDSKEAKDRNCLAICMLDEAQYLISPSSRLVDTSREFRSTLIVSTQQVNSMRARLTDEEDRNIINNLKSHYIGKASSEECASFHEKFYGEEVHKSRSDSYSAGVRTGSTVNYDQKRPIMPAQSTLNLKPFEYVVSSPSRSDKAGIGRFIISPVRPDGLGPQPWWLGAIGTCIADHGLLRGVFSHWTKSDDYKKALADNLPPAVTAEWKRIGLTLWAHMRAAHATSIGGSRLYQYFGFWMWVRMTLLRRARIGYQHGPDSILIRRPLLGDFQWKN